MSIGAGAIRAGLAAVELSADLGPLMAGLNQAAAVLKGFAGRVARIGASVGGLGASIVGPIGAAFKAAVDQAADMDTLATQLGTTADKASALAYALGTVGISSEELVGFTKHLNSAFASAADGSHEAADGFAKLGLNWMELARLPVDERLIAVSEALKGVTKDFDRSEQAAKFFGRRGMELLKLPTGELQKRMAAAGPMGAVVSPLEAAKAREIQRAFAEMGSAIKFAFLEIGRALLPQAQTIKEYASYIAGVASAVREWISANKPLILGIVSVGGALTAAGTAAVALAAVLGGVGAAMAIIAPFVVVGLKVAAVLAVIGGAAALVYTYWDEIKSAAVSAWTATASAISTAWQYLKAFGDTTLGVITGVNRFVAVASTIGSVLSTVAHSVGAVFGEIGSQAVAVFSTIKDVAVSSWEGIVSAAKRGDWASVWEIIQAGADVAWEQLKASFGNVWDRIKIEFLNGWDSAIAALKGLFYGAIAAIGSAFSSLIKGLMAVITAPIRGLAWALEKVGATAKAAKLRKKADEIQSSAAGNFGDDLKEWAAGRKKAADEAVAEARAAREEVAAERRAEREEGVRQARARLRDVLAKEAKKGRRGGTLEVTGPWLDRGPQLQQAAREVRGSFSVLAGAGAQQQFGVGSAPWQRQLVDQGGKQLAVLEQIRDKVEGPVTFG